MSSKQPPPKIEVEKSETYKHILCTGVYGGHSPSTFDFVLYQDRQNVEDSLSSIPPNSAKITIQRILHTQVTMTPVQAKSFLKWLSKHLTDYEKKYGPIPDPSNPLEKFK